MSFFCAYVHARPRSTTVQGIFHVGKGGNRKRMYNFCDSRNKAYKHIRDVVGSKSILVGFLECSTEDTAYELEKGLIKRLRLMGVSLTNETPGGLGLLNPTPEMRERLSPNWERFGEKAADLNRERVWTRRMRKKTSKSVQKAWKKDPKRWITDGTANKRIGLSETPPEGWRFGRTTPWVPKGTQFGISPSDTGFGP